MSEGNANQPVTERLCQERHKNVYTIQEDLKEINGKLDEMQTTLTELSTDTRNHFQGHAKGFNKALAIVMCVIALSAVVISLIALGLNGRKSNPDPPTKISQLERIPKHIVQYKQ